MKKLIEEHSIILPEEFLQTIINNNYKIPEL
jgi:hypothetical protein